MNKIINYKSVLILMIIHAIFVIIWNLVGVWLLSQGKSALGPTATIRGALVFTAFIVFYTFFYLKELKFAFIISVTIGALLGVVAIYGAFTKDHSLWPSEFWRYAGIAVNSIGLSGLILLIKQLLNKS